MKFGQQKRNGDGIAKVPPLSLWRMVWFALPDGNSTGISPLYVLQTVQTAPNMSPALQLIRSIEAKYRWILLGSSSWLSST